jgi:hypothetical protein
MEKGGTVYILGAGCSVDCGYPLATGFINALSMFAQSLTSPECKRIKQAAENTAKLLTERGVSTIDSLVSSLTNERFGLNFRSQVDEAALDEKIYDAKIATNALFLQLEPNALSRLGRYERFLWKVFPGHGHWQRELSKADTRVLTFNYDRLFEMAFVRRFQIDTGQYPIYGENVLNSGLIFTEKESVNIASDTFCFLKLHGSVGMAVREEYGKPCHYCHCDGITSSKSRPVADDDFYPRRVKDPNDKRPEPLIIFPNEKDYVRSNNNRFPYREYVTKVWHSAEQVVADATQINVIGYSFHPIDRKSLVNLLSKRRSGIPIVVQNPDARAICADLAQDHLDLDLSPQELAF